MNIQSAKKNWIWIALVCTLAATAWVASSDGQPAEALLVPSHAHSTEIKAPRAAQLEPVVTEQAASSAFSGLERPQITTEPRDLFSLDHSAREQMQAQASAASIPQMPPLPFLYAGKLMEGDQYMVFLTEGERNLAVHIGDVIDQVWRIKSIHPPQMLLSYLPLKMDATLDIGESN
ncbi:hypothetical protein [Methyloradius palustris]|uniref:Secretion system X translation initiation factor n=1 Tax=Methyloradius palustris TaxID=2778876 RepID=A0A8D5JZG7_9PROT|nr:hypothetical protein [Methyloradius palustris]BCM25647.1 hypothetical protein ZMTM_19060 [Methyloradius palustris]